MSEYEFSTHLPDPPLPPDRGTPIPDTYLRGWDLFTSTAFSTAPDRLDYLREELAGVVLIPVRDWDMILSNTLTLGARAHAAESQLNDLALYIRGRFSAQIAAGSHEGVSLPDIIKRYLAGVSA